MSKKKKDIYKEEMEVENYHTTYEAGSLNKEPCHGRMCSMCQDKSLIGIKASSEIILA